MLEAKFRGNNYVMTTYSSFNVESKRWLIGENWSASLAGGYIRKVTPVPIPNTVVKLAEPMILHQWESRSLPAL